MTKKKTTGREKVMLLFLVVLLVGVVYYMGFYQPTQNEIASIRQQISEADAQIAASSAKIASINAMQAELDEIFSRPEDEITEIAPYDNVTGVMAELNGILAAASEYNLSFQEPSVQDDGTVRRVITMSFSSDTYETARDILQSLTNCQWRCMVSNLSLNGSDDFTQGSVSVSATITFFESTKISG